MFIIKHITLENFMGIDNLDLDFEPNQITAITGIAGSGKSTLMFAIALAFSGFRKGETYRSYIKSGCSYAKINIEAYLKGEPITYDITITCDDIKRCKAENVSGSKSVTYKGQTYYNNDYNQFIKDNELDSMQNIMFMFQKESDISTAKPVERAEILRKIFGFDDIQLYTDVLKKELEEHKLSQIEYTSKVNELSKLTFNTQPLLRTLPEERIGVLEKEYNDLNEEFYKLKNIDVSALQKEYDTLDETNKKLCDNNKNIIDSENKIKNIKNELKDIENKVSLLSTVQELEQELERIENESVEHKKSYDLISSNFNELNTTLKLYNHELKEVIGQIKISETGVCHACGQPVDDNHVKKLEERKLHIENNISNVTESIEKLHYDPYDTKGSEYNSKIRSINSDISKVKSYELKKESLQKNLDSVENWLKEYNRKKEKYIENINELNNNIEKLKELKEEISKKSEIENKMVSLKETLSVYKTNIVKNKERKLYNENTIKQKNDTEEKILKYNEKLNKVTIDFDDTKKAIDFIEKDLTNELVIRACKQLSDSINTIIKKVFPYMSVKLQGDKKGVNFFYNVDDSTDDWLSISMASGGQQQVLSLAYKLAVAKEFGCNSIFLDEIDSSCNIDMAKTMYEFIFSLEDFNQIFLISHKPDVIEVAKESNNDISIYLVENGEYSLI